MLSLILGAALKGTRVNPVSLVRRPREPDLNWRILSPVEVRSVERAYDELISEAEDEEERLWRQTCRVVFLTIQGGGLRAGELSGLHWRTVKLADPAGATLRVEETFVRGRVDTPKSKTSTRTIALGPRLAEELFQHRRRSAYDGEDERVFCNPLTGGPLDMKRYAATFRLALERAGITDYVRPCHDGRHSSITNAAAAGTSPMALMARAGHADFKTTQVYIDLAGERFREEAELLEQRLWGESGTKKRYEIAVPGNESDTEASD